MGGTKLEDLALEDAIDSFENLYLEKSGNSWQNRDHFVKVPGKMYPMEVDYGNVRIPKRTPFFFISLLFTVFGFILYLFSLSVCLT